MNQYTIITINVPDQFLEAMDTLVNMGYYPSRSEVVRQSLRGFTKKHAEFMNDLQGLPRLKSLQMDRLLNNGG